MKLVLDSYERALNMPLGRLLCALVVMFAIATPGGECLAEGTSAIASSVEAEEAESSNAEANEIPQTLAAGATKTPHRAISGKPAVGVSSMDWLKAILGLIGIVLLIFLVAWFVKRFTGLAPGNQQHMRVISALPVGTRERIALISVADKQLLVGITQHNINLLHSFDEPVVDKNDKSGTDFATRLQGMLNKGSSV